MTRSFLGGIVAGFILFALGWIFWQTPLSTAAYTSLPDAQGAAVQQALDLNLRPTGTGTYRIPNPNSTDGAQRYTHGPVATIDFAVGPFSQTGASTALPGFIIAIVSGFLLAFGLGAVGAGRSFADLARLVICASLAFCAWTFLATPITYHFGWSFWIYTFLAESISFIAAGLAVARWFVPQAHIETRTEPPTEV